MNKCFRCDHEYDEVDYDDDFNVIIGFEFCPTCGSCNYCYCCPCNKPNCAWCGPDVAYREIRKQLLNWSISQIYYGKKFRREPQRLMALLRFEKYKAWESDREFKYKVIESD